jgi:EmrB/QacA subfamily drug resistance transporter
MLRFDSAEGRWVLAATVLGSGIAALDATVVNVALPAIGEDLDADVAGLEWVLTGYLLTLASLILLGGALGDRFGRRRIFLVGVGWFSVASVLCGLAPNLGTLIAARLLQGIGGALLTPASLAILEATFVREDRARAIGAWSGLGGVATAIGPFAGGWLIAAVSWRLVFLLNVPLAAIVVLAARHIPETMDPSGNHHLDIPGTVLGTVGLAGLTFGLIEREPVPGVVGLLLLVVFVIVERSSHAPLVPVGIFRSRQFTAANLFTVTVYAALAISFFLLTVELQQALGYSPTAAGAALLPITFLMLALSARAGALASRIGPRLPMTAGPSLVAVALLLMTRIEPGSSYITDVMPAVVIMGLGLAVTVAPLTATVLAAASDEHAGIASGINNAVARVAGLLAVATIPGVAGITGQVYLDPNGLTDGFHTAMVIAAVLTLVGAVIAVLGISDAELHGPTCKQSHCSLDAPPLRSGTSAQV